MSDHVEPDRAGDTLSGALEPMPAIGPAAHPESRIGERIRHARGRLNLSIEGLSRYSSHYDSLNQNQGLSPASISRYEAGQSLPGARELRLLCDALSVSADWLLFGLLPEHQMTAAEQTMIAAVRAIADERAKQVREPDERAGSHPPTIRGMVRWDVTLSDVPEALLAKARKP